VLLNAGADVNARMPDGKTALAIAEESSSLRFARLHKASGASR
jgi:ankyrin repeat protein